MNFAALMLALRSRIPASYRNNVTGTLTPLEAARDGRIRNVFNAAGADPRAISARTMHLIPLIFDAASEGRAGVTTFAELRWIW